MASTLDTIASVGICFGAKYESTCVLFQSRLRDGKMYS